MSNDEGRNSIDLQIEQAIPHFDIGNSILDILLFSLHYVLCYSFCHKSVPFQKEVLFRALKGNALTGTLQTGPRQTDLVRSDAVRRLLTTTHRNKILTISLTACHWIPDLISLRGAIRPE
jgi:hypothetical protein